MRSSEFDGRRPRPQKKRPKRRVPFGAFPGHRKHVTEGEGFEPSCACARTAFEAGPIDHLRHPSSLPCPTGGTSIGVPGFEPGTSPTRTERSTGLSHTPSPAILPAGNQSSGRGGIRTHAGFRPHDFQSCALSRSATRPECRQARMNEPLGERREWDSNPRGPFDPTP